MVLSVPPLVSAILLLLLCSTAAQPYTPTDKILLNCGTAGNTTSSDGRSWESDARSKFSPTNITTAGSLLTATYQSSSLPDVVPYMTARVSNSTFTYRFPVSAGPKFLRLYFYPAVYSDDLNITQSFFSVTANGFSLLSNFSAFLAVSYSDPPLPAPPSYLKREFIINIRNTQFLELTFSPNPNSFAFINGIEIVSLPETLYVKGSQDLKLIGQNTRYRIDNYTAFETIYRLNVGGNAIRVTDDTGMFRKWENDVDYLWGGNLGLTPNKQIPIIYNNPTLIPNYTAPDQVYTTQRTMGNLSTLYNLTWIFPVDPGFYYLLRLHFCNILDEYTSPNVHVVFRIFINNRTAEEEADVLFWTQASGHPVVKDYTVWVDGGGSRSRQDLWVAMQPNVDASSLFADAMLNGLEIFKMNSTAGSLAGINPDLAPAPPGTPPPTVAGNKKSKMNVPATIGGLAGGIAVLSVLIFLAFRRRRRQQQRKTKHYLPTDEKSEMELVSSETKSTKHNPSSLPSDRCRRFSIAEVRSATCSFDGNFVIGHGGFGKVYKGYIDNGETAVAIKRLNPSSNQGLQEFQTEIGLLSKLRHLHLVSLIGYCDEDGEMILVYEYMTHGTLREHLYNSNNDPLSWKQRLRICIGAAKGLHYLHMGSKRSIIHRDVKSTNILLDEKWVAKVSDFGLSKMGPKDVAQDHVSTVVKGSFGYVDPEYYKRQQLTEKSDVYSFGVVLFEVLCARPVVLPGLAKEQVSLAEWAKYCYKKDALAQIIDPNLKFEIVPECLKKFGEIAYSCLNEHGIERPNMNDVVWSLEFALQLQESAEKIGGVWSIPDTQEDPLLAKKGDQAVTTTDDDGFTDSGQTGSRFRSNGTSSINSSGGFKSDAVFSEIQKPSPR